MTGAGPGVGALDGLKVLDLSRVLAGPWCAMTLGDMGADVWKVEHPAHGDDTRAWGPPFFETESAYYLFVNRNKRSIAIDLKHPEGRALVVEMALKADVLVENFRTGALAAYGLDWDTLRGKNPRLIYCSISGYGRTGPKANYPGYDYLAQAECGLMSITGEAEGKPVKVGVAIVDLMCGMTATQGVLAALAARTRTGRGQLVDCALHDVGVAALANVAASTLITGGRPKRYGNAHATVVPYEAFHAADGDFVVTVGNDRQFDALCRKVIDRPDLASDERFATNPARIRHIDLLSEQLNGCFGSQPVQYWLDLLTGASIPAGRIREIPEVLASPEVLAREMVVDVEHPLGALRMVGSPIKLSDTPLEVNAPPPLLGQHTDEILGEILDRGPAEIERLRAAGAVSG